MPTVFERIKDKLTAAEVPFTVSHHEPVFTSERAAAVRGVALSSGAKALVVKADDKFVLLVVPADRKLDSKKARANLRVKSIRFATQDEVLELTGLQPGSIPPLGSLFNLSTYVDPELARNGFINFNAGDHAISIQLTYGDFAKAEKPGEVGLV